MTSFEAIYRPFLASIQDEGLGYLSKEEFFEALELYLVKSAVLDFKECEKELTYQLGTTYSQVINGNGLMDEFLIDHEIKNTIYHTELIQNDCVVDDCFYNFDEKNLSLTLEYRVGVEDILEKVDLSIVYEYQHVFEHVGKLHEFKRLYVERREVSEYEDKSK